MPSWSPKYWRTSKTTVNELSEYFQIEPDFFENVITGDETWVFEYVPETNRHSAEWHIPAPPKEAKMSKSKVKTMLVAFFDAKVVVCKVFVPPGMLPTKLMFSKDWENGFLACERRSRLSGCSIMTALSAVSLSLSLSLLVRKFLAKPSLTSLCNGIEVIKTIVTTALNEIPVGVSQGAFLGQSLEKMCRCSTGIHKDFVNICDCILNTLCFTTTIALLYAHTMYIPNLFQLYLQ